MQHIIRNEVTKNYFHINAEERGLACDLLKNWDWKVIELIGETAREICVKPEDYNKVKSRVGKVHKREINESNDEPAAETIFTIQEKHGAARIIVTEEERDYLDKINYPLRWEQKGTNERRAYAYTTIVFDDIRKQLEKFNTNKKMQAEKDAAVKYYLYDRTTKRLFELTEKEANLDLHKRMVELQIGKPMVRKVGVTSAVHKYPLTEALIDSHLAQERKHSDPQQGSDPQPSPVEPQAQAAQPFIASEPPKFPLRKLGDKVSLIDKENYAGISPRQNGRIVGIDHEEQRYEIEWPDGTIFGDYPEDDLKDAEEKYSPLFDDAEREVIDHLVHAWNAFTKLDKLHSDEQDEFRHAIHSAQRLIMARPVQRDLNERIY